jgi:hypothetical protein
MALPDFPIQGAGRDFFLNVGLTRVGVMRAFGAR